MYLCALINLINLRLNRFASNFYVFQLMNLKIKSKKGQNNHKKNSKKAQTLIQLDAITLLEFVNPQFKKELSLNVKLQLQKKTWTIQNERYFKEQWALVFSNLIATDVKILSLFNNSNEKIILQINHVNFLDLQILEFDKNHISNIEKLYMINAPNLYHISIAQNQVANIKAINKCAFPKLACLKIWQNFIPQVRSRSMKASILEQIISDDVQLKQNNFVQFQDVSILSKLELKQKRQTFLEYEQGRGMNRIYQKKIIRMYCQKNNNKDSIKDKKSTQTNLNTQNFLNMMMANFYK